MVSPRRLQSAWVVLALALLTPADALAIRVANWNILNYPAASGASREDDFRVVMTSLHPDVLVTQEMTGTTSAGQTQFLNNVLNAVFPGEYAVGPWVNGPDTNCSLFYRTAAVDFVSNQNIPTDLRDIAEFVVRPDGYSSSAANLYMFSFHLKAGSASADMLQRDSECTTLRNFANGLPANTRFMFCGDYNMQSSSENAYQILISSTADNDGRGFDPINRPGSWNSNVSFADIHTQSTRTASLGDGGATGGMDDRFDIMLASSGLMGTEGLSYIPGTYDCFGQDGQHCCNAALVDPPTIPEGAAMATALMNSSDHMPVFVEIQLPAKVSVVASIDFGTVIVGATANQTLTVTNSATAPADELSYTLSAPAGFTAPGGSFTENAGGGSNMHTIGMGTGAAGNKAGNLTVNSDDVDFPSKTVALSGTVLRHAVPAVDAGGMTAGVVDFGLHMIGGFSDMPAEARNNGYDALQAQLNVYGAAFTGPDAARFSIVGGFSSADVGGTPAAYTIHFDDTGAMNGTTYTATLTFTTRDQQGIPGATNLSNLTYSLSAQISTASASPEPIAYVTRLIGNHPNPFNPVTQIAFELGHAGFARLNIFDVRGRLVVRLVDGDLEAGKHDIGWDGRDDQRLAVGSGIYFYQLEADGKVETKSMTMIK